MADRAMSVIWFVLGLLTLAINLVIWFVFFPTNPQFILQDATLHSLNTTQPNLLNYTFNFTLYTRNPNKLFGVYDYKHGLVYATYYHQLITPYASMPRVSLGHKKYVIWPFFFDVNHSVDNFPNLGKSLEHDQNVGLVLIYVIIEGRIQWKVGSWAVDSYDLIVKCPAYFAYGNDGNNVEVKVGDSIKFRHDISKCHVSVN